MAAIQSLLNPLPDANEPSPQLPSPCSTVYTSHFSPPPPSRKKQKLSKDAAVFTRGSIRGECRYPPCEDQDDVLAAHHQQFEIHPMGHIAEYPRHIPYNSEKKSFLDRTGRESFEVFQYTFKVPGDDKAYCMMWDYNIGLVRTTPLFKCSGYSKTTPAKMLNRNPGLREICHSITGGALVAQGYWMPFEAAKAVAATFCWNIRYALTPVFGAGFPSQCLQPGADRFGEMVIDSNITRRCTEKAKAYLSLETTQLSGPSGPTPINNVRSPLTPDSPSFPSHVKQLRPKGLKLGGGGGISSGYSTDAGSDDHHHHHHYALVPSGSGSSSSIPQLPYRNTWTPANTPRSVAAADYHHPHTHTHTRLPSPREILAGIATEAGHGSSSNNYNNNKKGCGAATTSSASSTSSPPLSPKSRRVYAMDEDYDGDSSAESSDGAGAGATGGHRGCGAAAAAAATKTQQRGGRKRSPPPSSSPGPSSDEKAAYLLMSLRMKKADLNNNRDNGNKNMMVRGTKRRAST